MLPNFRLRGKASFVLGGQWGSEGKGAAAAAIAVLLANRGEAFDIVTTNAGAQAGHTSTYKGVTRVAFHLPTAALIQNEITVNEGLKMPVPLLVYLNAGSIIDPVVLAGELADSKLNLDRFAIHPNAAVITDECREAEGRADSAQTKIASTRKGVGEALSRKVLRSGMIASQHPYLRNFTKRVDLNEYMDKGCSVLVEVPQGISLSLDGQFYPHCTSRNCTVGQAMSDAGIHPTKYGSTMLVLRTYPIRVGNINDVASKDCPGDAEDGRSCSRCGMIGDNTLGRWPCGHGPAQGYSGDCYNDQAETSWEEVGQKAEITTVTKRVRRVFTFSVEQMREAMASARPDVVYLTFCDYVRDPVRLKSIVIAITEAAKQLKLMPPTILCQYGPTTDDVHDGLVL